MPLKLVMLPPQTTTTREWAARLLTDLPEISVLIAESAQQAQAEVAEADAAFGTLTPDLLRITDRLRWLQAPHAAPPAGYYFPALIAHQVTVTNFRGIYNDIIGTQIMAYVLAFARGLHRYYRQQLRREWKPAPRPTGIVHLPAATMVIVGVGGIGAETARLAAAFGVQVIGIDARRKDRPAGVAELYGASALDSVLPRADFVVVTVPHTPETEGFMNRSRFQRMKRSAFFINIGRGKTTRLDDLGAALEAGEIAGAALDVFEQEPLPADHSLWMMPGVLITPHTAGYGPGLDDRRYEIILDNCRRLLAGEPLRNVVDKATWY